jgi:hypothetical protein
MGRASVAGLCADVGSAPLPAAQLPAEKLICASAELSALDDQLNAGYQATLAAIQDRRSLQSAQRKWLKEVRNGCSNEQCAADAMRARLTALYKQRLAAEGVIDAPLSEADRAQACDSIARLASEGNLLGLFVPEDPAFIRTRAEIDWIRQTFTGGEFDGGFELSLSSGKPAARFGQYVTLGSCPSTEIYFLSPDAPAADRGAQMRRFSADMTRSSI